MKRGKKETWERLVTIEGKKDAWRMPYKILEKKNEIQLSNPSMKLNDAYEHVIDELAKKLLNVLFLACEKAETEELRNIRGRAVVETRTSPLWKY